MRGLHGGLAIAVAVLALAVPASAAEPGHDAEQGAMVEAINEARAEHGLRPLRQSDALTASADAFATRLMASGSFGHAPAIQAAGGFERLGEVISMHSGKRPRARRTVRRWLASPGHRAVLLARSLGHVGAGLAQGRFQGRGSTIWVVQLGGR